CDRLVHKISSFVLTPPSPSQLHTLSLHDALPIYSCAGAGSASAARAAKAKIFLSIRVTCIPGPSRVAADSRRERKEDIAFAGEKDRKSTRLNSSHEWSSYAVFCLKKKTS